MTIVSSTKAWKALEAHAAAQTKAGVHLRDLLQDKNRNAKLTAEHNGVFLDYARQRVDDETMRLLFGI